MLGEIALQFCQFGEASLAIEAPSGHLRDRNLHDDYIARDNVVALAPASPSPPQQLLRAAVPSVVAPAGWHSYILQ